MTKPYKELARCPHCGEEVGDCPHCGKLVTTESPFGRWVRDNKNLDSRLGHVFYDLDLTSLRYIVHKYKTKEGRMYTREIQHFMIVEIKTHGADLDDAQHDSFLLLSQLIDNERRTPNKEKIMKRLDHVVHRVFSSWLGKDVYTRLYGVHLLQFSKTNPEDSKSILWDRREISKNQLEKLLKFELNPKTLRPIDFRIHHKMEAPSLFPDIWKKK